MLNLSEQLIEASVTRGRIYLRLTRLAPDESVEIETPSGSLSVLQAGSYDINIGTGDQPTKIVVFDGKAHFVGGDADLPIAAGKEVQVTGKYPSIAAAESDWAGINPAHPSADEHSAAANPNTFAVSASSQTPALTRPPSPEATTSPVGVQATADTSNTSPPVAEKASVATAAGSAAPEVENQVPASSAGNAAPTASEAPPPAEKSGTIIADSTQKPADQFLVWVEDSDQDQQPRTPPQSTRYVSAEITGADALDRYGHWETLPDSEPVWFPASVPEGWAPYRFGHWASIEPWGWTWIDDQPWGFAPFHYGRWVNIDDRWGWVPGAVEHYPVYAPALVAFVDTPDTPNDGPNGGPGVGWFPLGPGDDYAPWYQAGPAYIAGVNAPAHWHPHDFNPPGYGERGREFWRAQYANRRFATVVSREVFAGEHRIGRDLVRPVEPGRLEHAAVMHGGPQITPVAMRSMERPGELRGGEPHGAMPAAAAAGGLHPRPGGAPETAHGFTAGRASATQNGRSEGVREGGSGAFHGEQRQSGHPQGFQGAAAGHHGNPQQFGRPQGFQGAAAGYRGNPQQFGRPQGFQGAAAGYHGNPQQFGHPQGFQGAAAGYRGNPQQFGRPQVPQGYGGGAQPFGRPQMAQAFRGGAQFGRPQAFQTPAAFRGGGMMGRAAAPVAARPAPSAGGGGGRHK